MDWNDVQVWRIDVGENKVEFFNMEKKQIYKEDMSMIMSIYLEHKRCEQESIEGDEE